MTRVIVVGHTVTFKRNDVEATGKVVSITRCQRRGDKFGQKVKALDWDERDYGFLLLDAGYCYGSELQ